MCSRLDNLPLAVELAAARTKVLSPAQILDRLSERLDVLRGGRDAEPRQQTLRATIEWSYDLLTQREQELFRALSVFAGGCTLAAAEDVADADLDTLQSLVEKSLLRFSNDRYWMLETIREYASEMLDAAGDGPRLRQRHAEWFQQLVQDAEQQLAGIDQFRWLDLLDAELDNLRAALAWLDSDRLGGVRMATSLWRFWQARNHLSEGRSWLVAPADLEEEGGPELAVRVHVAASRIAWKQADFSEGLARAEAAYEIASRAADDRLFARPVRTSVLSSPLATRREGTDPRRMRPPLSPRQRRGRTRERAEQPGLCLSPAGEGRGGVDGARREHSALSSYG